jgi:phage terminase large subunit GpA-like protein
LNIVVALFSAEFLPGPFLFLTATEDLADELVRDRLKPIFKASPFGKGLKANDLRLDGASFPGGGSLHVVAVGSPSAIKSRPARGGAFDEFDESFHRNKHLGCPLGRFKTRTRTYGSLGRHIVTSTPVNDSEGIWTEYEKSRRHEWRCPCPHCGHYQALELSQIKWPRNAQGDSSETPERIGSLGLAWYEWMIYKSGRLSQAELYIALILKRASLKSGCISLYCIHQTFRFQKSQRNS